MTLVKFFSKIILVSSFFCLLLAGVGQANDNLDFLALEWQSSVDQVNWSTMVGERASGFAFEADLNETATYFKLVAATTTVPIAGGDYGFYLTTHPAGWREYWEALGVSASSTAGSEEESQWLKISGQQPFFTLTADSAGKLAVTGDYPALPSLAPSGDYVFSGYLTAGDGQQSESINIVFQLNKTEPSFSGFAIAYSTDLLNWQQLPRDPMTGGFALEFDPNQSWYYFNVLGATTTIDLAASDYPFYYHSYPEGFWEYWDGLGVNASATPASGEEWIWKMNNSLEPSFYLRVAPDQTMSFVNGYDLDFLEIDGLFPSMHSTVPLGPHAFVVKVASQYGVESPWLAFVLNLKKTAPAVDCLTLKASTDKDSWQDLAGNLTGGFAWMLNPIEQKYYFDINLASTTRSLKDGLFPFYLTDAPDAFGAYWDALGVNASSDVGSYEQYRYRIISGQRPFFYLQSQAGVLSLIDGFQYDYYFLSKPLEIASDYPAGDYVFSGSIISETNITSEPIAIKVSLLVDQTSLAAENLSALSVTTNSIVLSWTNNETNADFYELKYSTAPIDSDNFASATALTNLPVPILGSQQYQINNLNAGTTYYFALRTTDDLTNQSALTTVSVATQSNPVSGGGGGGGLFIGYPPINPRVIINNGISQTTSTEIMLDLSADNMLSAYGPLEMAISNNESFSSVPWQPYQGSINWSLSSQLGTKTIYVKFKNNYGISATVSDSIELVTVEQSPAFQLPQIGGVTPQVLGIKIYNFTRDLTIGNQGADVTALQTILMEAAVGPAAAKLAQVGATGYFGDLTKRALVEFQLANDLKPASGLFGQLTRDFLTKQMGKTYYNLSDLKTGDLVKIEADSAIYLIDTLGRRRLFPNEATYWTWYSGSWAEQDLKLLSQDDFDKLGQDAHMTVKPGLKLVKFENSPRIYEVIVDNKLSLLSREQAKARWSENWENQVVIVQNAFEVDYIK